MDKHEPVIQLLTEDALLISFHSATDMGVQRRLLRLASTLRQQQYSHFREIVPAPGSLMLRLRPDSPFSPADLSGQLEQQWDQLETEPPARPRHVTIPVQYGGHHGPDLIDVARHTGMSPAAVVALHTQREYEVMCLGFQPGFPYLAGLDPRLAVPRRATPRTAIAAGSVAIGGDRTGIYPSATPGGWHIIGHTSLRLFDPETEPPTLLLPGDRLRFVMENHDDV